MTCLQCESKLKNSQKKYCSNSCQKDFEYTAYIDKWKLGLVDGNRGKNAKNISRHIVKYLFIKYKSACSACGWHEINSASGNIPLEVDHIDGNSDNNQEVNLRLLCPNCHALTPNNKNLNKGSGRVWRRKKYVKIGDAPP